MIAKDVEEAKNRLKVDLENNPHVLSAPLGHGVTKQKIYKYIFVCVLANIHKSDCVDWLYALYNNQSEEEKQHFKSIIDTVAEALYDFKKYLKQ